MKYLITGAGQIGTQLAADLVAAGHTVTVLRRSAVPVPGTTTVSGDAADIGLLRRAAEGAAAVFHCIHSTYDARAWRRDLPHRERAVMDLAAELGIPVVFPESVYAYGTGARRLTETAPFAPVSPLGEVRRELLEARAAHPARTLSVVAADLVGPTANGQTAAFHLLILEPASRGRSVWAMGDPDAPRTYTYIPDLTAAMAYSAAHAEALAPDGDAVLTVPAEAPLTQRQMAQDAAAFAGHGPVRVRRIPTAAFHLAGVVSPMMRELANQSYLWSHPSVLQPGRLMVDQGLRPTAWDSALRKSLAGAAAASPVSPAS
ncbi:NAD-dependent epimerase/dehydratase family protein [Brevibacterium daeguense]|uniref:NAD-dependent epimerase/dehydratase family protein n=1 Tax=Brevibacterium daeguense TaxID=909936 RepID=A0ABP8EEQ7_9MICO|nr:NAD-dependent epimerase/dehydratase family protein [Brevibacterium daeguense]